VIWIMLALPVADTKDTVVPETFAVPWTVAA
jgi:hypothetical protein